jgi:3-oxoacyl-[acyl-carrier protein] reductase
MLFRNDETAAKDALEAVRTLDAEARISQADLADPKQVEGAVKRVISDFGRLDVLINNAFSSTGVAAKVHELELDAWEQGLRANLTGPFLVTQSCLKPMVEQAHGRIVFIGSLAIRGEPGRAIYVAAKNGQVGLMRTVAKEYARHDITANMVNPGYIDAGGFLQLDQAVRDRAAKSVRAKRLGTAEEVAEAVSYFASVEAGYTTGQVLGVDGAAP